MNLPFHHNQLCSSIKLAQKLKFYSLKAMAASVEIKLVIHDFFVCQWITEKHETTELMFTPEPGQDVLMLVIWINKIITKVCMSKSVILPQDVGSQMDQMSCYKCCLETDWVFSRTQNCWKSLRKNNGQFKHVELLYWGIFSLRFCLMCKNSHLKRGS